MMQKTKFNAAILIIGNEILSGRTQDTNTSTIAQWLNSIGVKVNEVRVIPDIESTIIETVNHLRKVNNYVFTTGGIGPTHDDITAQSISKAFNLEYETSIKTTFWTSILKEIMSFCVPAFLRSEKVEQSHSIGNLFSFISMGAFFSNKTASKKRIALNKLLFPLLFVPVSIENLLSSNSTSLKTLKFFINSLIICLLNLGYNKPS